MKLKYSLFLLPTVILLILFAYKYPSKDDKSEDPYRKAFRENYRIFTLPVPEQINFAGEPAPVDLFYTRESLERELYVTTYFHSSTIILFKKAYRWFPLIEQILEKHGIPEDFKYLALIESNFANVVSPRGAAGFWQLMPETARKYDLEVNKMVDERYHLEKATSAACQYLNEAYNEYQDWTLVAASYNAGRRRITESLEEQKVDNYYDLYLNPETARYVFRILAMKEIYENPVKYGFYFREKDFYPPVPVEVISVDTSVENFWDFAKNQGINYKLLKEFNPWIRKPYLKNTSGKKYFIKIPEKEFLNYSKLREDIPQNDKLFNDTLSIQNIR